MSELIKRLEEEQKCVRDANFDSRTNFCTPEGYGFIKGFDYCLSLVEKNEQPQLNENQEIVLEWLKENYNETENPIETLGNFGEEVFYSGYWRTCIEERYWKLTKREQFEILQAFGQWGMETNK